MPDRREPRSIIEAAEQAAAAGNYSSAEALLREAVSLQESLLGPLHPDLANTLNNLGVVCEITGNQVDAEHCFRRAVLIATTILDSDHPFVATSRKNLRDFCEARRIPVELPASLAVAARQEVQPTAFVDPPRESRSHTEPEGSQPIVRSISFRRLAVGLLGPAAMLLIVILTLGRPGLESSEQADLISAITTHSPLEIPPPQQTPSPAEPIPVAGPKDPAYEAEPPGPKDPAYSSKPPGPKDPACSTFAPSHPQRRRRPLGAALIKRAPATPLSARDPRGRRWSGRSSARSSMNGSAIRRTVRFLPARCSSTLRSSPQAPPRSGIAGIGTIACISLWSSAFRPVEVAVSARTAGAS